MGIRSACVAGLSALLYALPGTASADPPFSDPTKNAAVLEEAALTSFSLIGQKLGSSPGNALSIADATFSDLGWSFSLTGNYLGMPTDIDFTGIFDPASRGGAFVSAGLVGSAVVDGLGTWTWTDVSDIEEDLRFSTSMTFAPLGSRVEEYDLEPVIDKRFTKIGDAPDGEDIYQDFGIFKRTNSGVETGVVVEQHSEYWTPKPARHGYFWNATETATLGDALLSALESYPTGSVVGSVSTVPELSSAHLLLTGLAGAALLLRRRQRR